MNNSRNYHAHGGNEWVVGGKLTFLPGATVEGAEGLFDLLGVECSASYACKVSYLVALLSCEDAYGVKVGAAGLEPVYAAVHVKPFDGVN